MLRCVSWDLPRFALVYLFLNSPHFVLLYLGCFAVAVDILQEPYPCLSGRCASGTLQV
jgi:hypothetical protein